MYEQSKTKRCEHLPAAVHSRGSAGVDEDLCACAVADTAAREEEDTTPWRKSGSFCSLFSFANTLLLHSIMESARNEALCSIYWL